MRQPTHVMFFRNGNTAAFDQQGQIPELQTPWILEYAELLASMADIDPTTVDYQLPDGRHAEVFRTSDGNLNWRMK